MSNQARGHLNSLMRLVKFQDILMMLFVVELCCEEDNCNPFTILQLQINQITLLSICKVVEVQIGAPHIKN
jgi:hypothetical protein